MAQEIDFVGQVLEEGVSKFSALERPEPIASVPPEQQRDFVAEALRETAPVAEQPAGGLFPPLPKPESGQAALEAMGAQWDEKRAHGRLVALQEGFMRTGEGAKQTALILAEEFGQVPAGAAEAYTNATLDRRREFDEIFREEFGQGFDFTAHRVVGEVSPFVAFGAVPRLASAGGRLLANTALGATAGGLTFGATPAEKASNTIWGGVLGGSLALTMEIMPLMKNVVMKWLSKELDTPAAQEGARIARATGIDFTLAQLAMTERAKGWMRVAKGSSVGAQMANDVFVKQQAQALMAFRRLATKAGPKADYPGRIRDAFNKTLDDLLTTRSVSGREKFAAAQQAVAQLDNPRTIQLENFMNTLGRLADDLSGRGAGPQAKALAKQLADLGEEFADGVASPVELQRLLHRYGLASKGKAKLFTEKIDKANELRPAKELFRALNDDLDDAVKRGGVGSHELRLARDDWKTKSGAIDLLRDSELGRIFNKAVPPNPETIVKAMRKMNARQIRDTMMLLDDADPHLRTHVQRFFIEEAIGDATKLGSAEAFGFIPARLLKLKESRELFHAMFPDLQMRKQVNIGIQAIRRILVDNEKTSGFNVARLKEFAGILASRDKTFAARFASEFFTPKMLSKSLTNKDAVLAISDLARAQRMQTDPAFRKATLDLVKQGKMQADEITSLFDSQGKFLPTKFEALISSVMTRLSLAMKDEYFAEEQTDG